MGQVDLSRDRLVELADDVLAEGRPEPVPAEESLEPWRGEVPGGAQVHCFDSGGTATVLAREFAEEVAGAADGEEQASAVLGRGQQLDPSGFEGQQEAAPVALVQDQAAGVIAAKGPFGEEDAPGAGADQVSECLL